MKDLRDLNDLMIHDVQPIGKRNDFESMHQAEIAQKSLPCP